METAQKKDRPYLGYHIKEFFGETKDAISKEWTTTNNNRKKFLELFVDTVYGSKTYLNPPTNINVKEKISNIAKELENTLTQDIKAIDDLFNHFTIERNNNHILLNKQQSHIRNNIKEYYLIQRVLTYQLNPLGVKEFFNDIITTDWITIGSPDEHGNRIAKDENKWLYYINAKNKILISYSRTFNNHKHIVGRHSGSVGGTPRSIYGKNGEEIINRVEFYKEISEHEYFVSVGPRSREKGNKPAVVPSKITHKTDNGDIVTFYIDTSIWEIKDGKLSNLDKNKYSEQVPA